MGVGNRVPVRHIFVQIVGAEQIEPNLISVQHFRQQRIEFQHRVACGETDIHAPPRPGGLRDHLIDSFRSEAAHFMIVFRSKPFHFLILPALKVSCET